MALIIVRLSNKKKISDKRLLACKINGLKTPKPARSHPWRDWVSTTAQKKRSSTKTIAEYRAEAKERAKQFK